MSSNRQSLSDLDDETLLALSTEDFALSVEEEAKLLMPNVLETYKDVMDQDDDQGARVKAAEKISELAGVKKQELALPQGLSAEVFGLALAGLGQLAGIARMSGIQEQILKNVTPAKSDPRLIPQELLETSKPKAPRVGPKALDNEDIIGVIAHERFEITEPKKGA